MVRLASHLVVRQRGVLHGVDALGIAALGVLVRAADGLVAGAVAAAAAAVSVGTQRQQSDLEAAEAAGSKPAAAAKKRQPAASKVAVGRNEPCPCGSGKKFKKCCGVGA